MVELGYTFHLSNCKECAFNWQVTLLPKGGCHHPAYGDVRINRKDLCETSQPELHAAASFPSCRLQLKCHLFREDFLDYSRPRIATLHVIAYCLTLCDPMDCSLTRFLRPWDFPGKNTGVGCHFLLQEIYPTQVLNPGLPHCRQTLYDLSHQGRSKRKIG